METSKNPEQTPKKHHRKARSRVNRENQMIALAYDLAEKRLREGTASAQEIVHFLRMGDTKTDLEKEKLQHETELLRAKKEAVDSAKRSDERYQEAIDAFRNYSGANNDDE